MYIYLNVWKQMTDVKLKPNQTKPNQSIIILQSRI